MTQAHKFNLDRRLRSPWLWASIAGALAFGCSDEAETDSNSSVTPGDGDGDEFSFSDGGAAVGTPGESSGGSGNGGTASSSGGAMNISGGGPSNSCMADMECGSGMICQFGSCRAAVCTEDADCGAGRVCDAGRCGVETCDPPMISFVYTPAEGEDPDEVFLAGSMNSWSTTKSATWQLTEQMDGTFTGEFPLATGQHSYKYQLYTTDVMEPTWISDQNVAAWESDGFEGQNSRIGVSCDGLEEIPVECLSDDECMGGEICDVVSCVAPQCTDDSQCTGDELCEGGRCEPPACADVSEVFTLAWSDLPMGVGTGVGGTASAATLVQLAGSFTGWAGGALEMTPDGDVWTVEATLPGGPSEYKFIVDGTWIVDPANPDVSNENSLIEIPCDDSSMGGAGGMGGGRP